MIVKHIIIHVFVVAICDLKLIRFIVTCCDLKCIGRLSFYHTLINEYYCILIAKKIDLSAFSI